MEAKNCPNIVACFFLWSSSSDVANSPQKRVGRANANDGRSSRAFNALTAAAEEGGSSTSAATEFEEENTLIIKCQDNILKDPLSIKNNIKEEERNSLDIKWQDDIQDPLTIKDNVKEE